MHRPLSVAPGFLHRVQSLFMSIVIVGFSDISPYSPFSHEPCLHLTHSKYIHPPTNPVTIVCLVIPWQLLQKIEVMEYFFTGGVASRTISTNCTLSTLIPFPPFILRVIIGFFRA